jgi:deoxyribonuclease-4
MLAVGDGIGETESSSQWRVGVHTSIAGSLDQAAERARQIGCTAFQIFSGSPRMWKQREPTTQETSSLARLRARYDLYPLVVHANYLINLASPNPAMRKKSVDAFTGEIRRAEMLGAEYLVVHPGSCRDGSPEQAVRALAQSIRKAARSAPLRRVALLIENTCGQGNVLGGAFEQIRDVLALLDGLPVQCCIDTAHCFAGGMDLSTSTGLEATVRSLDNSIGLDRVPVIHTNDSRSPLASRRDRHEHIGKGGIGVEGFRRIVNHPALRDKTFILETPIESEGDDRRNLQAIRGLRERHQLRRRSASRLLSRSHRMASTFLSKKAEL